MIPQEREDCVTALQNHELSKILDNYGHAMINKKLITHERIMTNKGKKVSERQGKASKRKG